MADKTYYAVRQMRHPRYRTRMLQAGDVVEDVGPLAKLFEQKRLITTEPPRKTAPPVAQATKQRTAADTSTTGDKPVRKPAAKKAPRRKKTK